MNRGESVLQFVRVAGGNTHMIITKIPATLSHIGTSVPLRPR